MLEPISGAPADHFAIGGLSDNPPVAEVLERISETTKRDTQEGAMPGGEPADRVSQEIVLKPQEQEVSPAVASLEPPLAGSQPLQPRGHSRLEATPAVTRAGTAARSFVSPNTHNRSDSSHLAAITTGPALSELRGLRLCTEKILPAIAHETHGVGFAVEYVYTATTIQSCSAGENAEIFPNTFEEATTIPAKAQ